MSHFARVVNGLVTEVIVIEQDQINTGNWGPPSEWIQTSYNTRGGVHYAPNSNTPDGEPALRVNYAGIGFIYDSANDVFYPPKPYPSWVISSPTWQWQAPIPMPTDGGFYFWDEAKQSWEIAPWTIGLTTEQINAMAPEQIDSLKAATTTAQI